MHNIERLIADVLELYPEVIDISDGELRDDNGFYSETLSKAWDDAEIKNGITGNDADFMIWSVFGLLHRKGRENFAAGVYKIYPFELDREEIKREFEKSLEEAK